MGRLDIVSSPPAAVVGVASRADEGSKIEWEGEKIGEAVPDEDEDPPFSLRRPEP
jgi:hypothetical protein